MSVAQGRQRCQPLCHDAIVPSSLHLAPNPGFSFKEIVCEDQETLHRVERIPCTLSLGSVYVMGVLLSVIEYRVNGFSYAHGLRVL